jgi:hypothetical protein
MPATKGTSGGSQGPWEQERYQGPSGYRLAPAHSWAAYHWACPWVGWGGLRNLGIEHSQESTEDMGSIENSHWREKADHFRLGRGGWGFLCLGASHRYVYSCHEVNGTYTSVWWCFLFLSNSLFIFTGDWQFVTCIDWNWLMRTMSRHGMWPFESFASFISTLNFINGEAHQTHSYPELLELLVTLDMVTWGYMGTNIFNSALKHLHVGPRLHRTPQLTWKGHWALG